MQRSSLVVGGGGSLEVLLVEDELDVGLRVGQTLFLQRLPQLRGATQEHPHLGSATEKKMFFNEEKGNKSIM